MKDEEVWMRVYAASVSSSDVSQSVEHVSSMAVRRADKAVADFRTRYPRERGPGVPPAECTGTQ